MRSGGICGLRAAVPQGCPVRGLRSLALVGMAYLVDLVCMVVIVCLVERGALWKLEQNGYAQVRS